MAIQYDSTASLFWLAIVGQNLARSALTTASILVYQKMQAKTVSCKFALCNSNGWAHEECLSDHSDDEDWVYYCSHNCKQFAVLQKEEAPRRRRRQLT